VFITGNSGFPKSHDVSKAIDKAAGAEREVIGSKLGQPGYSLTDGKGGLYGGGFGANGTGEGECAITAPATDAARQWSGWGTALKPAWEPIIVARKPLVGTVAENVLAHGTGGINVDGCRVEGQWTTWRRADGSINADKAGFASGDIYGDGNSHRNPEHPSGRWPANLIHDGSDEVVGLFPEGGSFLPAGRDYAAGRNRNAYGADTAHRTFSHGDSGSAARFFYCAKASKADRDEGCEGIKEREPKHAYGAGLNTATKLVTANQVETGKVSRDNRRNHHPTVKPTALMRYLCRLVTPPGGIVLDPFTGSGSTGKGAVLEGFRFIGIEREAEYVEIAKARIAAVAKPAGGLFA
jgi:hypothetical protein